MENEKLVERLRKINANYDLSRGIHATITEAATALTLAQARIRELETALSQAEKLDREAATYVESVICLRTRFTGEPPYVGWKGLGLALREELDELDTLRARQALKEASE